MTYYEILRMVAKACIEGMRTGYKGHEDAVIQCATQIYIAQMNKNKERADEKWILMPLNECVGEVWEKKEGKK